MRASISRFKRERFLRGFKQVDLMRKTGIYNNKISLIENGLLIPTREEKEKLAEALGVPVGKLFPRKKEERLAKALGWPVEKI